MRQVFTSPRLENVERVAALLQEHGVVTRITNGRTFKGSLRGNFSYRETANKTPPPAVWVVRSEDQPKARELLRDAGLLDSGRSPTSYLSTDLLHSARNDANDPAKRRMFRIKAGLLISITIAISLGLFSWLKSTSKAPAGAAPASVASAPQAAVAETMMLPSDAPQSAYVAAVPSALAAMLATAELRAREGADVCLSVDGADPSETVLAQFEAGDRERIRSQSACATTADAASTLSIAVREYRTDGSGSGTVLLEIANAGGDKAQAEYRTLEVRRDGLDWEVKRVVP
jgi:hypothetical protein